MSQNYLRIIGGKNRGLHLQSPEGMSSRPTLNRIREAMFNILAPRIVDAVVADLYAGTGAIGLEACSRGCREVYAVEANPLVGKLLEKNARRIDPRNELIHVLLQDARQTVEYWSKQQKRFDVLFLDPPYTEEELARWHESRLDQLLAEDGLLILQHARSQKITDTWAGCRLQQSRNYGKTTLSFFKASSSGRQASEREPLGAE